MLVGSMRTDGNPRSYMYISISILIWSPIRYFGAELTVHISLTINKNGMNGKSCTKNVICFCKIICVVSFETPTHKNASHIPYSLPPLYCKYNFIEQFVNVSSVFALMIQYFIPVVELHYK